MQFPWTKPLEILSLCDERIPIPEEATTHEENSNDQETTQGTSLFSGYNILCGLTVVAVIGIAAIWVKPYVCSKKALS